MSKEHGEHNPPPDWLDPSAYRADIGTDDIRAIAKHVIPNSAYYNDVTRYGTVHIRVPDEFRTSNHISVSRGYETNLNRQNDPFSRDCYGPDGGKNQALTFWLKPEAMDENIDAKLEAFARALAGHHEIDPLEIQYIVPPESTLAKFDTAVGCGVAIATSAEHADDLKRVFASINRERIAAELPVAEPRATLSLPAPSTATGRDRFHWQNRFSSQSEVNEARTSVAIRDIFADKTDVDMHPVDIEDGCIAFDLSANMAERLGEKRKPLSIHCENDDAKSYAFTNGTQGLAIWMKPSFFNMHNHQDSEHYKTEIEPKIRAFADMLSARHGGIPLYPTCVPMHNTLTYPASKAASAIVLMTDSAHQNALMSDVRLDLMREFKKLSDGVGAHASDQHDNRRPPSSPQR